MLNYEFYVNTYKGKLTEDQFDKHLINSTATINYYTFNRIEEYSDTIKLAICELIDLEDKIENDKGIASETVDDYSVSYKKDKVSNKEKQKEIIFKHLGHTSLLYRGV